MTRPDLAPHASAELAAREARYPERVQAGVMSADEAGRGLAAWRAILALLEHGEAPIEACLGETPAIAWAELLAAVQPALEHRARKADEYPCDSSAERFAALKQIRSALLRSAVRQGAQLSAIDDPLKIAA